MKKTSKPSGLSNRALLVAVNISQWAARKKDNRATATANAAHKADDSAGSYHKKLLPGASELRAVETIVSQTRAYITEQTLPWMSDGTRILAAKNYIKFTSEMRKFQSQFESAVKDFAAAYPRLKAGASKSLGDLYDSDEYPSEIESRFGMEVNYLPLPDVKDFRVEVSEAEKREFERKMRGVESAAMKNAWSRLHTVVKTAAAKLAQPGATFRDSLLDNVTELVALLPMLNVSEDSKLDAAAKEVSELVSKLSPDTLRDSPLERDRASKALSDIQSRMGAFMGQP